MRGGYGFYFYQRHIACRSQSSYPSDEARAAGWLGDVQQIFNQLSDDIATRVAEINALKAQGDAVWPVLSYADIKAGHVTAEQREQIKRRGCAVIKAISPRTSARLGSVDAGLSGPQPL